MLAYCSFDTRKVAVAALLATLATGCSTPEGPRNQAVTRAAVDRLASSGTGFGTPAYLPASSFQVQPAVAGGGGVFLSVWQSSDEGGAGRIWGTRIAADGARLDRTSFPISTGRGTRSPAVLFDGTNFLVIWTDDPDQATSIGGARVTPGGAVLDQESLRLAPRGSSHGAPVIAFDGSNYVIADTADGQVRATRASPSGGALGTVAVGAGQAPGLACNGTDCLVAYWRPNTQAQTFQMFGRLVTRQGGFGASEFLLGSGSMAVVPPITAVASNGDGWLVFYHNAGRLRARRVSAAGTPLGGEVDLSTAAGYSVRYRMSAVYLGGSYYLFFDGSDVIGLRLDANASVTAGPTVFTTPTGRGYDVTLGVDGTNLFAVYAENMQSPSYDDISGRRISPVLAALDTPPLLLSQRASAQYGTTAAFNGARHLVVWTEWLGGSSDGRVYGTRVAADGQLVDSAPFPVTTDHRPGGVGVASNGADWLVAWDASRISDGVGLGVLATRVTGAGVPLAPNGFAVGSGTGYRSPVVASNGTDYLVVWTHSTVNTSVVRGARVAANGTALDGTAGFAVHKSTWSEMPGVAWNGTSYLVASRGDTGIVASRVGPDGALLDANDIYVSGIVGYGSTNVGPAVGSDGDGWLVAWPANDSSRDEIRAARISASGGVLDANGILVSASGFLHRPSVTWDGTTYWVAWEDRRNAAGVTYEMSENADIYIARFRPDGTRLAPAEVAVAQSDSFDGLPTLSAGGGGMLLSYTRFEWGRDFGGVARARAILLQGGGPAGTVCTAPGDCESNACVDGVCCDTACTGTCQACTTLKKGSGADGVCGPIVAGSDPDSECDPEAPSSCGRNGSCDGNGGCQLFPPGSSCGSSFCDGNTSKGQICDGGGTCVDSTTGVDCSPYACATGACRNPCGTGSDCQSAYVCVGGACVVPGSLGTPCTSGSECATGHCTDGVCCDAACTGTCVACSAAKKGQGADGECGPIRAARDPDDECAEEDESTCGQNGQCDGAAACARWADGTECAPGSCSGEMATAAATCNADGECVSGMRTACVRGYRCDGQACATGCDGDAQCTPGYVCEPARGACVPEDDGTGAGGEGGDATSGTGGTTTAGTAGSATGGTAGTTDPGGEGGEGATAGAKSATPSDGEGCGCRTTGRGQGASVWLVALFIAAFARRNATRKGLLAHEYVELALDGIVGRIRSGRCRVRPRADERLHGTDSVDGRLRAIQRRSEREVLVGAAAVRGDTLDDKSAGPLS